MAKLSLSLHPKYPLIWKPRAPLQLSGVPHTEWQGCSPTQFPRDAVNEGRSIFCAQMHPLNNRRVANTATSTTYKVCVPRYAKCRVFWAQLPLIRTLLTPHHPSQHPSCFSQSPMTRSPIMIFIMGRNTLSVPSSNLCQILRQIQNHERFA